MPTTWPWRFSSGPPLLPGLMAASVCSITVRSARRTALMMPRVTLFWNTPSARPMAITSCPGRTSLTVPSGSTGCEGGALSTRTIARSYSVDDVSTRPGSVCPFESRTVTDTLFCTTWRLVMTVRGAAKNPLPRPWPFQSTRWPESHG